MVHQRLKCRVEIVRLIRKQFTARLVGQGFDVEIWRATELPHTRGPNHDPILQSLSHFFGDDAADDTARFVNRLGRRFSGRPIEAIKVAGHAGDNDDHAATDRIAGADHVIRGIGK